MKKKSDLKILAIIPARGGSKTIPRKNIKIFCKKPLIYHSIKAGLESNYINRVVVSTEDKEIASISEKYKTEVIKRPKNLAKDDTPSIPVFKHVLQSLFEKENYRPDIVVILQPTSPLRTAEDIDVCIEKLMKEKCDSVITVKKIDHPIEWVVKIDKKSKVKNLYGKNEIKRRQDSKEFFVPNGAVYVTRSNVIINENTIKGQDTRAVIMPNKRSVDIDTELDFYIAEQIAKGK